MQSKLGNHLQTGLIDPRYVGAWVKMLHGILPEGNPYPGSTIIGRLVDVDAESNALIALGAQGADRWFDKWWPVIERFGYVWAWEAPNEPQPMEEKGFRAALIAFSLRLIERFNAVKKRMVGLNFGVGWPDWDQMIEFGPVVQALHDGGHLLGLHEYCAPRMDSDPTGSHTRRYRRFVQTLKSAGRPIPGILIGECGIDGGVLDPPRPKTGWKTFCETEAEYMEQLAWYDGELAQDPLVLAAFPFTSTPNEEWMDFEVNDTLHEMVRRHRETFAPPVVEPCPEPVRGIDVSDARGVIDWATVPDWVQFVGIRVSRGPTVKGGPMAADGKWKRNHAGAQGRVRFPYHYLMPADPEGQAELFARLVQSVSWERSPVVDIESTSGLETQIDAATLRAFVARFKALTGGRLDGYTSRTMWNRLIQAEDKCGLDDLWVADWRADATAPLLPSPWAEEGWTYWQYSSKGQVAGVPGNCDLDRFRGTWDELNEKPDEGSDTMGEIRIFDAEGKARDWAWLKAKYGNVRIHPVQGVVGANDEVYKMIELREKVGPATAIVKLLDEKGETLTGRAIAQGWRDGPQLPDDMDPAGGLPAGYPNKGNAAFPNDNGELGFGWGGGEYYYLDQGQEGAHYYWVCTFHSEVVTGIGMLPGTEHAHLDMVFQRQYGPDAVDPGEPDPGEEPTPLPPSSSPYGWVALLARLDFSQAVFLTEEQAQAILSLRKSG